MNMNYLLQHRSIAHIVQKGTDDENPKIAEPAMESSKPNTFTNCFEEDNAANFPRQEEIESLDIHAGESTTYSQEEFELACSVLHKESIFKLKSFLLALFEHLLFYLVLGPFIYFYGCIANMNRLKNQAFVCGSGRVRSFLEQLVIWVFIVSSTLILFLGIEDTHIDLVELILLYIAIFVRALFIAVKYAYCSEDYLRAFNMRLLTRQEIVSELMVRAWRPQTDAIIEKDILSSMVCEEVDNNLFYFSFIGYISRDDEKKLSMGLASEDLAPWKLVPASNFGRKLRRELGLKSPASKYSCTMRYFRRSKLKNRKRRHTYPIYEQRGRKNFKGRASEEEDQRSRPKLNSMINLPINDKDPATIYSITDPQRELRKPDTFPTDLHENKAKNTKESTSKGQNIFPVPNFNKLPAGEKLRYYTDEITDFSVRRHFFKKALIFEKQKMSGYRLAVDLVQHSKQKRFHKEMWFALVIAIIKSLIPTFYRIYEKVRDHSKIGVFGTSMLDTYLICSLMIANCYFFWANVYMVIQAISQYRAKLFLLLQLGNLISPRNVIGCTIERLYPTFDIFDPVSIKTWTNLRKILWNYGAKFQIRQDLNITIYSVIYLLIMLMLAVQWIGWLKIPFSPVAVMAFSYQSVVVLLVFVYVLILAASINDTFQLHMSLLKKIKMIAGDMFQLDYAYFGDDAIEADNLIYRSGIMLLTKELGGENIGRNKRKFEEFKIRLYDRLSKLLTMISEEIEELSFEFINNPYKIIGFTINWQLISALAIGIGSFAFALIKKHL